MTMKIVGNAVSSDQILNDLHHGKSWYTYCRHNVDQGAFNAGSTAKVRG